MFHKAASKWAACTFLSTECDNYTSVWADIFVLLISATFMDTENHRQEIVVLSKPVKKDKKKKTGFGFMNIVIKTLHQPCWFAIAVEKHIIVLVNFAIFSFFLSSYRVCLMRAFVKCLLCTHSHTKRRYVCWHLCNAHQPQVHTRTLRIHCVVYIFIFSKMQVPQTEEYYQQQHANSNKKR